MEYATRISLGVVYDARRRRRGRRTALVAAFALALALAGVAIGGGFASTGHVGVTGSARATQALPARAHGECLSAQVLVLGVNALLRPNGIYADGFARRICTTRSVGPGVQRNR